MINEAIDYFQAKFPPAKLVTALSPLILIAAAYASSWCAQNLPGLPHFTAAQGALVAAPVVLGVATILYKRIDGWQKNDRLEQDAELAATKMLLDAGHMPEYINGVIRFPMLEPQPLVEPSSPAVGGVSPELEDPPPGQPPTTPPSL